MTRGKDGQSAVEFVLLLPILLALCLAAAQFFIICANYMMLQYAAYMAARTSGMATEKNIIKETKKTVDAVTEMIGAVSLKKPFNVEKAGLPEFLNRADFSIKEKKLSSTGKTYRVVTVDYMMPLKVPIANRFFGFFISGKTLNAAPFIKLSASAAAVSE